MATKKAAGSTKNGRDSQPKFLGIKINHGATAQIGQVIARQRGTRLVPGTNVGIGSDHTLFALKAGVVEIKNKRKIHFDNTIVIKKIVNVK